MNDEIVTVIAKKSFFDGDQHWSEGTLIMMYRLKAEALHKLECVDICRISEIGTIEVETKDGEFREVKP